MSQIQIAADHIAAFHEYLLTVSNQTMEISGYVWDNVVLNEEAFGEGLLAPIRDAIREHVYPPFGDGLSDERVKLSAVRDNLWEVGAALDELDGEVADYFASTASFQDNEPA